MSENKPSLQDQIKKRKQEEIRRTIEAKQVEKAKGPGDATESKRSSQTAPSPARQTGSARPVQSASPKRTTQIAPAIAEAARAPFRSMSGRQKTTLIAAGAALMIVFVCVGTFLIASNATSTNADTPTPTLMPIGMSSADALLQHLKDVGMDVNEQKPYDLISSKVWTAQQAYTFAVKNDGKQASFLILSFDTGGHAAENMFKIMGTEKYRTWKTNNIANVVMLASPDSGAQIVSDVYSHMTTFLYAPYRPWSSVTPPPTATSQATTAPTKAK
jgi:hypothetical protein